MIYQDKDMIYDFTRQEYEVKMDAVVNRTDFTQHELGLIFKPNTMRLLSQAVYRIIYGAYAGPDKDIHIRYMRKKIYNNLHGERDWLLQAVVELVRGAVESGMDLNAYTNDHDKKRSYPQTVVECLDNARLIDETRKIDQYLDITYTADDRVVN